ncbi:MAG: hypothetical protein RJA57_1440 [Bacteroidota bacterium]
MSVRSIKYLFPLLFFGGGIYSFHATGIAVWLPLILAWALIPLLELMLRPDASNLSKAEEELARTNRFYDLLLYAVVPLQYTALFLFLISFERDHPGRADTIGRIGVMGLLCGSFGINVAHELGHRVNRWEQTLAKALLLTSLYMHFFTEHNKGHHKRVATPEDPSSARYNEPVYLFYFRTIFTGIASAWHIAAAECRKKGRSVISLHNELILFFLIQASFIVAIYWIYGGRATLYFGLAALIGILLLETVNYIEHYGLQRKVTTPGNYERAMPAHSWNSNHVIGRILLFELSRHSDHHYLASRKYQVLRNFEEAPQMPTGYPGMILLSLIPPAWFAVMNKKIRSLPPSESTVRSTEV